MRPFILCLACLCWVAPGPISGAAHADVADPRFEAIADLSPAERHRQLSLMLLVSAGVDQAMRDTLAPLANADGADDEAPFQPDRYTTPLARIVDQATLLAGAERLFRFTALHGDALRARVAALESGHPEVADTAAMTRINEDTILIRQAIADSLATAGLGPAAEDAAARYRQHTVVLRNALEFAEFKAELDALTAQAIASVGGKLDAYQRMFDDEMNSGTFDRRIRSAELIYLPEGQFDPEAGKLTEEMLDNMVLLESQPNR